MRLPRPSGTRGHMCGERTHLRVVAFESTWVAARVLLLDAADYRCLRARVSHVPLELARGDAGVTLPGGETAS